MSTVEGEERSRGFQEAVSYAVGHRIRVEILVALHEKSASSNELARIVHQPLSTVTHHVSELLKAGAIRVVRTEKVRSIEQRYYGVINPIFFDDEEMAKMPKEELQNLIRVLLQSMTAEALAAFWAGKLNSDPRLFICWAWFNVDEEGRAAISEEQDRCWQRFYEIEEEAAARCAEQGKEPFSVFVSGLSCERHRTAPRPTF
jgi:DNA-binding transcriptional ArsR family regulator